MPPPYAVDTSIWIDIWRHYPPDIFASLWEQLRAAISDGHIVSPEEVLHELRRGTDGLAELLEAEDGLFIPLEDDIQAGVTIVMAKCPDLSDEEGERNRADPFVVALGLMRVATVVTAERPRRGTARRRIPDACTELTVPCLDWFGFLRDIGWRL